MNMKVIRYGLIAVVILVAAMATWKIFAPTQPTNRSVKIATFSTAIDYAPFFVARTNGYFDQELAKVGMVPSYTRFDALPPLNDALRLNQLDVVFEAEPPALIAESTGIDVTIADISATLTQRIIVRPASGIKTLANLKGHKIGVLTGTSSHYGLLRQLENVGLKADDVTIVNLAPPEGRAAFESGQIDAWAVWPPFPEHEQLSGKAVELTGSEAVIQSVVVIDGDFAKANPIAMAAVTAAVDRAKRFIVEHPLEAQQLVAKATAEPLDVVKAAWPKHNFGATLDSAVHADIDAKARFLYERHFLTRLVDPEKDLFIQNTSQK
jgi:sulfonate transport system substrate-binding protein